MEPLLCKRYGGITRGATYWGRIRGDFNLIRQGSESGEKKDVLRGQRL